MITDENRGTSNKYGGLLSPKNNQPTGPLKQPGVPSSPFPPTTRFNGKPAKDRLNGIGVPHFHSKFFSSTPKNTFDAELDRMKQTITLLVKIKFDFFDLYPRITNTAGNIVKSAKVLYTWDDKKRIRFITDFVALVEKEWSDKHAMFLKKDCNEPVKTYQTKVKVLPVSGSEHHVAKIYFDGDVDIITNPDGTTKTVSIHGHADHAINEIVLVNSDIVYGPRSGTAPDGKKYLFTHNVALHEFGHVIGVDHINAGQAHADPSKDPYGETFEQLSDVMGVGNVFSIHDYWPFMIAMYYFTGCQWEAR